MSIPTAMADHDGIDMTPLRHLAYPNWEDPTDRRCVAASLVNVVYLLQTNNKKAKEWLAFIHFEVNEKEIMRDQHDNSIFGAIFRWDGRSKRSAGRPPTEVVAFRGTILRPKTVLEDIREDLKVAFACMHSISRVDIALKYLRMSIQRHGSHNIWIAGHSLGAAIAMAAARKMSREERDKIEAHLFNPPFISPTLPQLKFFKMIGKILSTVRNGSPHLLLKRIYKSIQGACETLALRMGLEDENKLLELYGDFVGVSNWIPNLYVSEKDPICCSYLKYFKVWNGIYGQKNHLVHEKMKYLFCFEVAQKRTPWHLVPSAKLVKAVTSHSFHNHHGLDQWWRNDLVTHTTQYIPPTQVTQWNANTIERTAGVRAKRGGDDEDCDTD